MKAVIGMNYGDEGKGHITNFFSDIGTLNVRFNGGAQAGHSVQLADGRKHTFHHFGSGSMKGARTLLTHHFIVNPIIFSEEFAELVTKAPLREVFIDPRALVTTPFDMLINSFASWYNKQTNTCGLGINETIERSKFRQLSIRVRDLLEAMPVKKLELIENEYIPFRLKELKLPKKQFDEYFNKRIPDPSRTIEQYISVIKFMLTKIFVYHDIAIMNKFDDIVFEGAQGLLLDQGRIKYMPFLTRSNTGMKNILSLTGGKRDIEVYLTTRTYLTRHGQGPLMNEIKSDLKDPNNPYNPYQGNLRYGHFDMPWFKEAVEETRKDTDDVRIALTCVDQVQKPDGIKVNVISSGPSEEKCSII